MNEQVIQIGGKSYKQCDVVMLPTEKASKITFLENKLMHSGNVNWQSKQHDWEEGDGINQNLYILSDEEIKEGDWFLDNENDIDQYFESKHNKLIHILSKKIIATTDKSLEIACKVECHDCKGKGEQIMPYEDNGEICSRCLGTGLEDNENSLPRPSDDFLKAFVKAQGKITEVLVEYRPIYRVLEDLEYEDEIIGYEIRKALDNTITIKPIQEKTSWSREEVVALIQKLEKDGADYFGQAFLKQWIEENL